MSAPCFFLCLRDAGRGRKRDHRRMLSFESSPTLLLLLLSLLLFPSANTHPWKLVSLAVGCGARSGGARSSSSSCCSGSSRSCRRRRRACRRVPVRGGVLELHRRGGGAAGVFGHAAGGRRGARETEQTTRACEMREREKRQRKEKSVTIAITLSIETNKIERGKKEAKPARERAMAPRLQASKRPRR